MSVLVSHPTGNANSRAVLRALDRIGALDEFWTTVGWPRSIVEASFWNERLRRRLSQRCFPEVPWMNTRLRPWREATRLLARQAGFTALIQHETGWASIDGVYQDLDRHVSRHLRAGDRSVSLVYAYEDGALETFRAARDIGATCVYDLPIAHWQTLRRLLQEEAERLPEWACTMEGLHDSADKHARKDAELALADHIIVASSFTRNSLDVCGELPVYVAPYGCPSPVATRPAERIAGQPIELLFAGHLAQRKGVADLIAAVELLEIDWRLTLAGPRPSAAPKILDRFLADPRVDWLGTVPHTTLLERMTRAHVFVFPSIVEGFGMVITEALSAGLPVVTTPHTAGPDILVEGKDGFLVPIRSPYAIAERITCLAEDEGRRRTMAAAARDTAIRLSWATYEAQIAALVGSWNCRA